MYYAFSFIMHLVLLSRATAIIFMRRAGLPWLTISKITGHRDVANLVKYYDLKLEVIYTELYKSTVYCTALYSSELNCSLSLGSWPC